MEVEDEFVPIEGFEGCYEVNQKDVVRSLDRYVNSRHGLNTSLKKGLILTPIKKPSGYLECMLHNNKTIKQITIHRIVAKAFIPNPENKPQVNHIDGDKLNNNASNLNWVPESKEKEFKAKCKEILKPWINPKKVKKVDNLNKSIDSYTKSNCKYVKAYNPIQYEEGKSVKDVYHKIKTVNN